MPTDPLTPSSDPTLDPRTDPPPLETRAPTMQTGGSTVRQAPEAPARLDIAGYEVLEEIGHGGMGVVYKARQTALKRLVALKMILSSRHANVEEKVRFQIEAEAVARLQHPNIVQLYEVGEHDGLPFFSLEFCDGGSLDQKLKTWKPTPREAAEMTEELARAMHFAHLRGVVHRDLKPANILLASRERERPENDSGRARSRLADAKITDFGLAKRMDGGSDISRSGSILGTPAYMAPEQAAGKVHDTGPATDVYALGVLLYELLCGRPPFRGDNQLETMQAVMTQEPAPPSRHRPGVPRDLETICLKCLHKEPARRYASADEMADDLRRWQRGEPITARPVGRAERLIKWIRRKPALAALVAVLVVAFALVAWQLGETRAALDQVRREQNRREEAEKQRALARVNALAQAAPGAVPGILTELESSREDVLPRLRELWQAGGAKKMRVGLALLPVEPETVRDELAEAMLLEKEPAEVLLIRDALAPHGSDLRQRMWQTAKGADPDRSLRALVGLAAFDPSGEGWKDAAEPAVKQMVKANPLHLGVWVTALRPVRESLLTPLGEVYRKEKSPEKREFAATVLADYASDNPAALADLLLDADPVQYAVLFPVLDRYRKQAVERMRREVKGEGYWNDQKLDPSWSEPSPELRREIEAANGLLHERWALCQTLPLGRWQAVSEAMGKCGYRPLRLRPDANIAAVWTRDGRGFHAEMGLTADQVKERDTLHQKAGFIPADAAGYGDARFAVLWVKAAAKEEGRLYLDVPESRHLAETNVFKDAGFMPLTIQGWLGADGKSRFCGVWWKATAAPKLWNIFWDNSDDAHKGHLLMAEKLLLDVNVSPTPQPQSVAERQRELIDKADKELADKPEEFNAFYRRGLARFHLHQDAESLADFNAYLEKGKYVGTHSYLARLHARAGRTEKARSELATFEKTSTDAPLRALTAAIVGLHLADDNALPKLEATVKEAPKNTTLLYNAACVYAEASRLETERQFARSAGTVGSPLPLVIAFASPERSREHADRALALFKQALDAGYENLDLLDTDADLEPVRSRPEFQALRQGKGRDRVFASVWHGDANREAAESHGLSVGEHLERCRELAMQGYRPAALSVLRAGDKTITASAWHRPFPKQDERERLARRQATGAATLLKMDAPDAAWPLFRHRADPEARSQFIWRSGLLKVDAKQIAERLRLDQEKDVSARRALILALGEFNGEQLPQAIRDPLVEKLLGWYRTDPDPGIHGAIDWLLRYGKEGLEKRPLDWGQAKKLREIEDSLKQRDPDGKRRWYVNNQGQTMVLVPGPVEFRMGSPPSDPNADKDERPHRRRIPRSFAIGSRSVTVAEFQQFLKENKDVTVPTTDRYSPDANGPIIAVSWFMAAQYCNWLSEKEGLPESEWCYPKHADIKEDMKPYPDSLKRKGYRLPTEAEWEYAARAATTTPRYWGSSVELMPRYAWYLGNSPDRAWPVGQKRPNDLGLLDIQGNVWNWVQDAGYYLPQQSGTTVTIDREDTREIKDNVSRVLRGASFGYLPTSVRSAHRIFVRPSSRYDDDGLRFARTLP